MPRTTPLAAALPVLDHVCLSTLICQSRQFKLFNCRIGVNIESPPTQLWGVILMCVRRCPTFPPGLGSIIGAGRLSFRVRDGSGRFPAAMDRRNFIHSIFECPHCVVGKCYWWWGVNACVHSLILWLRVGVYVFGRLVPVP